MATSKLERIGILALLLAMLGACTSGDDDGGSGANQDGGASSEAGRSSEDEAGRSGSGTDGGTAGSGSTGQGDGGGDQAGTGGAGETDGGGTSGTGGMASGSGGTGGSSTTIDPELEALCDDLVQLHDDKAEELDCTGNDSAAQRRLCEVSGSCMTELEAHYDCKAAATTWSCDTTDGHPQTNASCEDTSDAFFMCLQSVIQEEDPFGCTALATARNDLADSLGCDPDDMLEFTCTQLYLRDLCLPEWTDLADCIDAAADAEELECNAESLLAPTGETCAAEASAFEDCLP